MTFKGLDLTSYAWNSTLWNDLKKIFPAMPSNAYQNRSGSKFKFLAESAIDYGRSDEILIYVAQVDTSAYGHYPWFGRSIYTSTGNLPNATSDYNGTWNFVHELGHYFGLSHTFPGSYLDSDLYLTSNKQVGPVDPSTNSTAKLADYWDLVYRPASPGNNVFYSSDSAASSFENQLVAKNVISPTENCSSSSCTISCSINGSSFTTNDPGGAGIGIKFPGDNPPSNPVRGWNAMGYLNPACPQGFSDSQIRQIQKVLRYDVPIQTSWTPSRTGLRPSLGLIANSPQTQPIDIDGDGRRDFGVWEPPQIVSGTGQFKFRKSIDGTLLPAIPFGIMGDVPALADYDNDGKTDIAVFRTAGPNGNDPFDNSAYFIWCPTSHVSGGDCSYTQSLALGQRGDVPMPGTRFAGPPASSSDVEIAVFRPQDKIYWRKIGNASISTINISGDEPIVGYFDDDRKMDAAVYQKGSPAFWLALASNFSNVLYRPFPAQLVPFGNSGTKEGRAGGTLIPGAVRAATLCDGSNCVSGFKTILQVWDNQTGTWFSIWDPVNSSSVSSCSWGQEGDIPLTGYGLVDMDSLPPDGRRDMVVWRPSTLGSSSLHIKTTGGNGCGALTHSRSDARPSLPLLPFVSHDINQDGKAEVVLLDKNTMEWRVYLSPSYVSYTSFYLGNLNAKAL
ncbi:MAG: hypothetical protein MUF64_11695 [Polyangiaceae bacterium]|jgi:hypothetical protein|nr:hypothetical protein [Polyangiaceae bacterium]